MPLAPVMARTYLFGIVFMGLVLKFFKQDQLIKSILGYLYSLDKAMVLRIKDSFLSKGN
jgi:hypothetical protein